MTQALPRAFWSLPLLAALFGLGLPAQAQDYPNKPVRIIVPFAPDGYTLLLMSNTHAVNESLIPNKPFQLMRRD